MTIADMRALLRTPIADIPGYGPRCRVRLSYNAKDITTDIAPHLESFTYTDNSGSRADEVCLDLLDLDSLWGGQWFPQEGDQVTADILAYDWVPGVPVYRLPCGTYTIDELTFHGPPRTVTLRGISAPLTTGLRRQRKHKAWEHMLLHDIARDIAKNAGLALRYDAPINPKYERKDQHFQSDLGFLQDFCTRCGLRLKVTAQELVIFDEETYERKAPVIIIDRLQSEYLTYEFSDRYTDLYRSCAVNWHDPGQKNSYKAVTFTPPNPPPGEILEINERVENAAEAMLLAKARLREKNREGKRARFTMPLLPQLVGAVTAKLINWHPRYDAVYMADTVTHTIGQGGSSSSTELHRQLIGY